MRLTYVSALVEVGKSCSINTNCGYFDTYSSQATWIATDSTEYKVSFDDVN